ncbi:MAG: outer membrane lipoprotein carrier protein LolA [Vicinamibacterales bacterium]
MSLVELVIALLVVSPAADRKGDLFDDIAARSASVRQTLQTVRAAFVETTSSTLLTKPLVERGQLVAMRPARLKLSYTEPRGKTIIVDEKRLQLIWPDRQLHEESNIEQAQKRVQQYFVDTSPEALRKHFVIDAVEDVAAPGRYRIDLRPTRKQIQQGLEHLQLWLDRTTFQLSEMRMVFSGGDSKTLVFTHVVLNEPVDAATFGVPGSPPDR